MKSSIWIQLYSINDNALVYLWNLQQKQSRMIKNPESLSGFVFKGIKVIILFYKKNKNTKMPLSKRHWIILFED